MPSQAAPKEQVNDAATAATGDQDLLELIQQGLQCSKSNGSTTQELRAADVKRFHSLLKVLVRACITAIPTKTAAEGFEVAATHARNTISIITRNITLRPEVLLSEPEPGQPDAVKAPNAPDELDRQHPIPLYKWILPRLVYAASLLINDDDERDLGGQIEECAVDVIRALTAEQGNGSEHIEGLIHTQTALSALRDWSWGSLMTAPCNKTYLFAEDAPHSHREIDDLPVLDDSPFFIVPPMSVFARLSFILSCIRISVSFLSPKRPPIPSWPTFFSDILVRMVTNVTYFNQALRRAIEGDIVKGSTKHLGAYFWYHVKLLDVCVDLAKNTLTLPSLNADSAAYIAADAAAWWLLHRREIMKISDSPETEGKIKAAVLRTDTRVAGVLERIRENHAARFGSPFWERLLSFTSTSVRKEMEGDNTGDQRTDLCTVLRCVFSPLGADCIRIAHRFSREYFDNIQQTMQKRAEESKNDAQAMQMLETLNEIAPAYEMIRIAEQRGMKRKRKDSASIEACDTVTALSGRKSHDTLNTGLQTVQSSSWVERRWKPLLQIVRTCGVGEGISSELEDLTDRDLAGMEDDESKFAHHVLTCLTNALSNSTQSKTFDVSRWLKLLGPVCCLLSRCTSGLCNSNNATLSPHWLQFWTDVVKLVPATPADQAAAVPDVLEALQRIYHHACCEEEKAFDLRKGNTVIVWLLIGVKSSERRTRIKAGRCVVSLHRALAKQHPAGAVHQRMKPICEALRTLVPIANVPTQEAILSTQGQLARLATADMLGDLILDLMRGLGSASHPLRSLAYVELLGVVKAHSKNPYTLVSPYLNRISVHLASHSVDVLNEGVQFLGVSAVNFLETTLSWTLPSLVLQRRRDALDLIVRITGRYLGVMLMDNMPGILSLLFMQDRQSSYDEGTRFLMGIFNEVTSESTRSRGSGKSPKSGFSLSSLLTSCTVVFLIEIIVNWGDASGLVVQSADQALRRAQGVLQGSDANYGQTNIGVFLKDHMLGIISGMNDILVDGHGKKSLEEKRKVIRSLGGLIQRVGAGINAFATQIMTSIQTAMGIPPLRLEAMRTWQQFIQSMQYSVLGQHIGPTIASLVVLWPDLAKAEKDIAVEMINYLIVDNLGELRPFIDNVVDLSGIPELEKASNNLMQERKSWPFKVALDKLLERCQHNTPVLSARSLVELKRLMVDRNADLTKLAKGDAFDPAISIVYQVLLTASGRDGDQYQSVRDAAYDCIGVLGALDPDRMQVSTPQVSVVLKNNFADHDETVDFALHVIETILVDAYRTTHDSKHQGHLSFTMQELLKFCKFSPKLDNQSGGGSISNKVRQRWAALSKEVLDVLRPLLEGKYSTGEISNRTYDHPIYTDVPTYREWLQKWTADLISRVMSAEPPTDVRFEKQRLAMENAKAVFGAFRPIVRHQDVGVVHYLLPHLVLYTLITGTQSERNNIVIEINTVLQDQVNPTGGFSQDKRFFSAQAIFDLLDHLSRWLQEQRNLLRESSRRKPLPPLNERVDKALIQMKDDVKAVDEVLSSIDVELTAHAALQSKAYARSLRNFEERIAHLKHVEKRTDNDLQAYYEHLHRIYADLDEPDGMEGVSISVIAPSLEHQIREHESVGRWTSAQSCWEVKLQQSPNDVQLHIGLMRCLRNLGHYDTLRTHIRGVLSRWPDWSKQLASLQIEAAWTLSDWDEVSEVASSGAIGPNISIGKVLLAMHKREHEALDGIITMTRRELGMTVTANHRQYTRAYDAALHLHMLHEVELIRNSGFVMAQRTGVNRESLLRHDMNQLRTTLGDRLDTTMPSYRVREPILGMRRTAFGLSPANQVHLKAEIGLAWIASSKNARKAGHEQTAYSATLQAKESNAPFAFVQQAKLLKGHGEALKALIDLENGLKPFLYEADTTLDKAQKRSVAKGLSLVARWSHEADRFSANDVVGKYKQAIKLAPDTEGPYYQLGHYYDSISVDHATKESLHALTCENYSMALRYGTKYIYQTMPRMLTLWLDLGEKARTEKTQQKRKSGTEIAHSPMMIAIDTINKHIKAAINYLPAYQWLTAFAQIVSRIGHPSHTIKDLLFRIMFNVLAAYPAQAVWSMVGIYHAGGGQSERALRCKDVFAKFQAAKNPDHTSASIVIAEAVSFSTTLLKLSNDPGHDPHYDAKTAGKEGPNHNKLRLTIPINFSYANANFPKNLILPLQDALTCTLPSSAETVTSHNPFPRAPVVIKSLIESVEIMPSLQRPKKIGFMGDDGKRYFFLVKPHDDLRKDARLMDFNSMINKLLKGGSESRKRQLHIRTYAVMPLNEECGLLEWVNNTVPFRNIMDKAYARHGKKLYSADTYQAIDAARKKSPQDVARVFQREVLAYYSPPVFHEWFFQTWPEPTAWLAARLAYGRSLAVMSMVGFVLGLGDRHGENILFDSTTGDTVHVDFNCLFEKGKTFDIPERVPFRLTHNLVDGLGTTGVEGVYRKAAEIALETLRNNRDSLMSVLEAFIHDPLVEWEEQKRREERYRVRGKTTTAGPTDLRTFADKSLQPINQKLLGYIGAEKKGQMSVANQVDTLIKEATSPTNLGLMYSGWASWL